MSSQFNDSDEDVALHTRRSSDTAYRRDEPRSADQGGERLPAEREVTLNTGIVLALFFGLALLCAVFFGFGYSMGRKSVPPAVAYDNDNSIASEASASTTPKPSPAVASSQPVPEYVPPSGSDRPAAAITPKPVLPPATSEKPAVVLKEAPALPASRPSANTAAPVVRVAPAAAPSAPVAIPPVTVGGTLYVQIAAVSHQEDADVLLSALHRRGYTVLTRSDANDKLIHVQTGPFGTRKEADAMRLKLAADGYNAFIK